MVIVIVIILKILRGWSTSFVVCGSLYIPCLTGAKQLLSRSPSSLILLYMFSMYTWQVQARIEHWQEVPWGGTEINSGSDPCYDFPFSIPVSLYAAVLGLGRVSVGECGKCC